MNRFLWLLAWVVNYSSAAETKTWTVRIDEEIDIGYPIVDLRKELNYSPERIFSLMSPSELFVLDQGGLLSAKSRIDFESVCVNQRDTCAVQLEVGKTHGSTKPLSRPDLSPLIQGERI